MIRKTFKIVHSGKNSHFNKWYWDNWLSTREEKNLDFYLSPYQKKKINSKWIPALNIRAKTKELAKENIDAYFHDLQLGNDFLGMIPKHR